MACTSGCPTPGAHASWGECARSKNLTVSSDAYTAATLARTPGAAMNGGQKWEAEMTEYPKMVAQGIQPAGTQLHQIRGAKAASEKSGEAYRADR